MDVQMPVTNVNLKLLQTFMLVAEHGSFRVAADQTLLSQSAISSQIKRLEAQLGTRLFQRTTRRLKLTGDGEILLVGTRTAMEQVGQALRTIRESVDRRGSQVMAGCSLWIASACLVDVLSAFEDKYPAARVFMYENGSGELLNQVRGGQLDFAAAAVVSCDDLDFDHILTEEFYAFTCDRHDLHGRDSITLSELARLPVLLRDRKSTQRKQIDLAMQEQDLNFRTKYEVSQAQTVIALARAGLGVAILPHSALPERCVRNVHVLRIVEPTISRRIGIVKVRGRALSPLASSLAQFFRQRIRPLQRWEVPLAV